MDKVPQEWRQIEYDVSHMTFAESGRNLAFENVEFVSN